MEPVFPRCTAGPYQRCHESTGLHGQARNEPSASVGLPAVAVAGRGHRCWTTGDRGGETAPGHLEGSEHSQGRWDETVAAAAGLILILLFLYSFYTFSYTIVHKVHSREQKR